MRSAFTLIELLVVITIIVVLLALLTPALDKAIYRAELLRCAANLKGTGTGVTVYATDFKRAYPYRPQMRPAVAGQVARISAPGTVNDTRILLRPYMSIKGHLLCPFVPVEVDFDASLSSTVTLVAYAPFFGVQYANPAGGAFKGMLRLGDGLEWEGEQYRTLITDFDTVAADELDVSYTSHPDADGVAQPEWGQDKAYNGGTVFTWSRWIYPTHARPPIDSQYALDDGSVALIEKVAWDEADSTDRRVAKVPLYSNAQNWKGGLEWMNIPSP